MSHTNEVILVTGATGQQGGATLKSLQANGWRVRALVRDATGVKARQLAQAGVELAVGDMNDRASLDAAVRGAYGVFSVQPSAGQPDYGVTSEDEVRFGRNVADAAKAAGVQHLIYTSVYGVERPAGVSHFESKGQIEQYIRGLGLAVTVLRPSTFMELLTLPMIGLQQGTLFFFTSPERPIPLIAVDDIGAIAATVFDHPKEYVGKTIELAGDVLSGTELAAAISRATNRSIAYSRFPQELVRQNQMFERLTEFTENSKGTVDVAALQRMHPGLMTFDTWLGRTGKGLLQKLFSA